MIAKRLAAIIPLLLYANATDKVEITCAVVQVKGGESANVTCNFNRDLRQLSIASVTVEHYPHGTASPETLLDCTPIGSACQPIKGYEFNGLINTELVLKIVKASKQNEGRYVCKMLSPDLDENDEVVPCSFTLDENVLLNKPEDATTRDTSSSKSNGDSGLAVEVVVPVVVIAVVLVLVLVVGVIYIWKRKRNASASANQSSLPLTAGANHESTEQEGPEGPTLVSAAAHADTQETDAEKVPDSKYGDSSSNEDSEADDSSRAKQGEQFTIPEKEEGEADSQEQSELNRGQDINGGNGIPASGESATPGGEDSEEEGTVGKKPLLPPEGGMDKVDTSSQGPDAEDEAIPSEFQQIRKGLRKTGYDPEKHTLRRGHKGFTDQN